MVRRPRRPKPPFLRGLTFGRAAQASWLVPRGGFTVAGQRRALTGLRCDHSGRGYVPGDRSLDDPAYTRPVPGATAAILTLALVVIAGAAQWVVNAEVTSLWDGVWWAVVTATTVGYGDVPVTTAAGRIIGILVMALGIAFVSLLTAAIAARFIRTDEGGTAELREALNRIEADLAEIKSRLT